jgi:hypothetical protein
MCFELEPTFLLLDVLVSTFTLWIIIRIEMGKIQALN